MTELQLGLIGLGTAAVAGVFAYNKWQEHRHRKVAESVLQPQHDDVLLGRTSPPARPEAKAETRVEPEIPAFAQPAAGRVEPVLHGDDDLPPWEEAPEAAPLPLEPVAAVTEPAAASAEPEPVFAEPAPVLAEPVATESVRFVEDAVEEMPAAPVVEELAELPPVELPAALLDPRVDFIVSMELVDPVAATQILRSQREVLQRLGKPVHWVGFNERTREWERLAADSSLNVRRLRAGLQLVNRLGPVADADVAVFVGAMQALADELMAVADMPSTRIRDQAAELDRFCAEVDLEIGINLVSKGAAFSGTKIRALAEAAGMVLGGDGLFVRQDDDGRVQFCLQNFESTQFSPETIRSLSTHGITFLMDVPRVDHGERVFLQMAELAKRFAETLQGQLVDDNRQPLGEAQLEHIRREFVGKPQHAMNRYGLPAGSPQALRLFS